MKTLNITSENFSLVRETLKEKESCKVNNKVTLVAFVANTEKVNKSGKKTRTPFYYVTEAGAKLTSTQLKELLGIETETKGSRKETTFASIWEQVSKLAEQAESSEIEDAIKHLQNILQKRKEAEAEAEAAKKEAAAKVLGFASFEDFLKASTKKQAKKNK